MHQIVCRNKEEFHTYGPQNIYFALVRPHLEYANSVWSPYKKGDVEAIEKIQKRATKLVISIRKLPL